MKQLLGFAVLTGPLFLIVLWVPVCLFLAFLVGKKFIKKSLTLKITGGLAVFLIALFLPVSDEIAGRIYFNHLCKTEGGVKVYQTIELPAKYWDEDGKPRFYNENNGNFTLPAEKFYKVDSKKVIRRFGVQERRTFILNINTNEIIGEKLLFRYWGGYILKNFTPHNSAIRCGSDWDEFVKKQFTQTMAKGGE
jgi:hypothetical protein